MAVHVGHQGAVLSVRWAPNGSGTAPNGPGLCVWLLETSLGVGRNWRRKERKDGQLREVSDGLLFCFEDASYLFVSGEFNAFTRQARSYQSYHLPGLWRPLPMKPKLGMLQPVQCFFSYFALPRSLFSSVLGVPVAHFWATPSRLPAASHEPPSKRRGGLASASEDGQAKIWAVPGAP